MNTRFVIGLAVVVTTGGLLGSVQSAQRAPATTTTTIATTSTTTVSTTTAGGSINSGVYTAAQAKRGEAVYNDFCAKCHLDDLSGGASSPPLKGDDFLKAWQGKTLGALFDEVRLTMPFDGPGSLTSAQNADVLAYMLNASKFSAGEKELDTDPAALGQITIEMPK